jgi:hypothetical protein
MKKKLLIILLSLPGLFFINKVCAQIVPNGGFENWTQKIYLMPDVVPPTQAFGNSNQQTFADANVLTMTKVSNGTGSAMRLETKAYMVGGTMDTTPGYAFWGNPPQGGSLFPGGFPFTDQNVTSIKVDLRYSINALSPGLVVVQFKKNGVPIDGGNAPLSQAGIYAFPILGTQSTFSTMTFNISPALTQIPDTCVIGFISNSPNGAIYPGDYMEVDSIMFTGTPQTVPGGNLDSWVNSPPIESLDNWNFSSNNTDYKTTDKNSGNFAIALPVLNGNGGNGNEAVKASLGTIIYSHNGPNIYNPGMAVTGNPQSIGFYYKYSTPGIDSASVYVRLTKWNGTSRDDVGGAYMYLLPQSNYGYSYAVMNYQNGLTADSAYIEFSASRQYPNSVVGSLLTVDDVRLNYCNEVLTMTGSASVCPNATGLTYSIQDTPLSTYAWTVPTGATITSSGTTGDTITVDFGAIPGLVSVTKSYVDGCPNNSNDLTVSIQASATAFAGNDASICANGPVNLNGSVTGASGGSWSGGAGTYSPDDISLSTVYSPSAAEIAAGSVTLTLTTTGNGGCTAATDDIIITITSAPTAYAGADQTICENDSVRVYGTFTLASGLMWTSSGNGSFIPDNISLNSTYIPSNGDKANGNVTLAITTTGGSCPPVSDAMMATFSKSAIVYAGDDQTICTNTAPLNGSVTNATGGTWFTSGSGSFIPNANTLTATYSLSAADIAGSTVTITLTSTGNNSPCTPTTDQLTLTYTTCTGIYSGTVTDEMKIYPSPSSSFVNIELKSGMSISNVSVLNTMSQDVNAHVLEINGNTASIDMSALNAGMYFIRVSDGQSVLLKKVVKE